MLLHWIMVRRQTTYNKAEHIIVMMVIIFIPERTLVK